jgi:glycosyltransferase involved in cell wall biosynthesis
MKIAVCMMFRDEADILDRCLLHWAKLGTTNFYLCDNGSCDGSGSIAGIYANELTTDLRTNFPQAEIVNGLIKRAHRDKCDWIFPIDADEFIQLPSDFKKLTDWLSLYPGTAPAYGELQWLNVTEGNGGVTYKTWHEPHRKVFGRFDKTWKVSIGNHLINEARPTLDNKGAYYLHYHIRGYEHFRRKMINYMEAFVQLPGFGSPYGKDYYNWKQRGEEFIKEKFDAIIEQSKNFVNEV